MKSLSKLGIGAFATGAALVGGGVAKADGVVQQTPVYEWVWGQNGCVYLTDDGGATAVMAGCSVPGGIEIDVAQNGQWVIHGTYPYQDPFAIDTSSWLDQMSGGASVTGDARVDGYLAALNQDLVDPWVQQTCIEIVGDTCYV